MEATIIENQEIQKPSFPRAFVEDSFKVSVGDLGGILNPVYLPRYPEPVYEGGRLKLKQHGVTLELDYDYLPSEGQLVFQYWMPKFRQLQYIGLDSVETKFGQRPYFVCDGCGKRYNCLYLRLDSKVWSCRDCHNLIYQVKKYNKKTTMGFLGYSLNRHLVLEEKEARIKRIDYAGKLTRKAASLVRLIKKWSPGFHWKVSEVEAKV